MPKNRLGLMAAVLLCSSCSQAGSVSGKASPELTMPDQIDVIFNYNARSRYLSPLTGDWRNGDDMEAWLIDTIDGANGEELLAVQVLSLPRIAQALNAAQQRGVYVAVVLENKLQPDLEQTPAQQIEPARQATLASVEPLGLQQWRRQHKFRGSLPRGCHCATPRGKHSTN